MDTVFHLETFFNKIKEDLSSVRVDKISLGNNTVFQKEEGTIFLISQESRVD